MPQPASLAPALLAWFDAHGRHDLPWQREPTPYRVWVSEVMLQQTGTAAVAPYFERFMSRFPDLPALAAAPLDEVLHLWSGLGYYARARNLHRAARLVVERHGGRLPDDIEALRSLPGIGRSTAGAILALSRSQRHPILDGNARRVLARYFGVDGHAGEPAAQRQLWALAEACTPQGRVASYTQAIMDLGAGVCRRTQPRCDACPLCQRCTARLTGRQHALPAPRPKRQRPRRTAYALVVTALESGAVLLERRPDGGLWGGLWSFPMFDSETEAVERAAALLGRSPAIERLPACRHAFTHYDLTLYPLRLRLTAPLEPPRGHSWYDARNPARIGVSKPVGNHLSSQVSGVAS